MKNVRKTILQNLSEFASEDEKLIGQFDSLAGQHGNRIYPIIFDILTNLDLDCGEAKKSWQQVVWHRRQMSVALGREVSLRTAICDYFSSVNKSLENPKIIEIHIFEQTKKSSRYDSLTDLLNRGAFDEALDQEISRASRHNNDFSLIFFDLDNFKRVNDTHGHQAGDDILKNCAATIKSLKRTEDIAARYGGEELVLLLPDSDKTQAQRFAERIRRRIEEMEVIRDNLPIKITLSGGVASYPIDATTGTDLIKYADEAMYRAKSFGKNNIVLYSLKKRRSTRYGYQTSLTVKPLGLTSKEDLAATSRDISVNGILFESNTPLDMGTTVELSIMLANDQRLLLIGNVVRVKQISTDQYDIGISFLKTSRSVEGVIANHILKPQDTGATDCASCQ